MEMAQITAVQVLVMFLLMAVGYICRRIGMITEAGSAEMNRLLIMVVAPAVIINSYNSPFDAELFRQICDGFLLAVIAHVIALALAFIFIRGKDEKSRIDRFGTLLSNSGFMGIPLVEGIVGSEGVLYGSFFIAVFNIFCWTYGYVMMGGGKVRLKALLLNPGLIGLVIGLPLYLLDVPVPALFVEPVELISALNTPLAMIVVGGYIAQVKLRAFVSDLAVYKMAVLRLVVAPLLYLALVWLLRPDETLLMSTVIQAATPVAANCVLFAVQYGSAAELASKSVAVSTALSVVTIPLLTVLVQALL